MNGTSPPLAGVIGWPVGHSRSPRLHGHWLRRYGVDGYYVPLGIAPENLEAALRALPRLGFRGVNVTIPHKERALELAETVSERAAAAGAANTLTFGEGGRIEADNTDGYGFIANLRQRAPDWTAAAGPAVVLGAGAPRGASSRRSSRTERARSVSRTGARTARATSRGVSAPPYRRSAWMTLRRRSPTRRLS